MTLLKEGLPRWGSWRAGAAQFSELYSLPWGIAGRQRQCSRSGSQTSSAEA